jgi:hypothetical protein
MSDHACEWAAASPVKLSDGGVEVVGVNHDLCRDPIVAVDFGDDELLGDELPVPSIAVRVTHAKKGEAFPANRNNG